MHLVGTGGDALVFALAVFWFVALAAAPSLARSAVRGPRGVAGSAEASCATPAAAAHRLTQLWGTWCPALAHRRENLVSLCCRLGGSRLAARGSRGSACFDRAPYATARNYTSLSDAGRFRGLTRARRLTPRPSPPIDIPALLNLPRMSQ